MGRMFDRTIVLCKETDKNGKARIRRIPWDILAMEGEGFMVSPVGVAVDIDYTETLIEFDDFLHTLGADDRIDDITGILWVKSEESFYAMYEGVFGMYVGDEPAGMFGDN